MTESAIGTISNSKSGSGTGTRTLNVAVNRSGLPVQKSRFEFAECRRVPPNAVVCHRRCCTRAAASRRPTSAVLKTAFLLSASVRGRVPEMEIAEQASTDVRH